MFRNSAFNFDNTAQCTVIWNYRTLFGVETPTFDIVHSILADHSFNLDVNALVGKVHTISAKRKTISAESIQFRKCLIGFCKRFPSPDCRPLVVCYPDCPVTPRGSSLIAPTSMSNKRVTP